jgi:hypothetical protein
MPNAGEHMKAPSFATAWRRLRARLVPDLGAYAPVRWLALSGLVLMAAIAIGTAFTIARFRESAIETGKQGLESAVLLLARHFDQQFGDFAILQKDVIAELQAQGISQPDIFRSEMATLAVHEMLRARVGGQEDVAGVNLFDSRGVLINSSQSWPVADIQIADRAYFRALVDDVTTSQAIDIVQSRLTSARSIVFGRKVLGPHGEFLGVVSRAISPEKLETFFASAGLGPESTIAMHHRKGILLARFPHVEAMIGESFNKGPSAQRAVFGMQEFAGQLPSPVDGKERLVANPAAHSSTCCDIERRRGHSRVTLSIITI